MPDISVVIPTLRRPATLVEAIRSALAQDGVQVEVLVVDDSPEGSARDAVASVGDRRVSYRKRRVPTGGRPGLVRNDGWPDAIAPYVHFLDDDDRVAPGAYRALADALDASPRCGVAFGRVEPFGQDPSALAREQAAWAVAARRARRLRHWGPRIGFVANQLFQHPIFVNSACLIRRDAIPMLGGYDPAILGEDLDFYTRAIRQFGAVFVDRVVLEHRTGTPSPMHDLHDPTPVIASLGRMYEKYVNAHGAAELLALKLLARGVIRWT